MYLVFMCNEIQICFTVDSINAYICAIQRSINVSTFLMKVALGFYIVSACDFKNSVFNMKVFKTFLKYVRTHGYTNSNATSRETLCIPMMTT